VRYLGGKPRLAKHLAAAIAPRGRWWDPFCGGLSVSVQLAKFGPGLVSDIHPALIALYRAVREGWEPPASLSREEWGAARALPDSDPRKAFAGFGCSFGGKWFGGYAAECGERVMEKGPARWLGACSIDQARATRRGLLRDVAALERCELRRCSFFDVAPRRGLFEAIYCDPPYRGVTAYALLEPFDHDRFWARCAEWAAVGARVFVSEYACPLAGVDVALERRHRDRLRRADGGQTLKIERLYRIGADVEPANDNGRAPVANDNGRRR